TAESLLNGGGGGSVMGGDVLSLFDHNQSISGAPTLHSASSSSSLGLLPINCDVVSALGSVADSGSSNALGEMNTDGGPLQTAMLNNNAEDDDEEEEEEEDGGTTEEKSVLYPNQALPPPVYTNISKLQAAAQRSVGGPPKDSSSAAPDDPRRAETPPLASPTHPLYDNQPEGMRVSLVRCCSFVVEPPTTCGARQKYPLNMTYLNNTCIFISPALRQGIPTATHSPQSVNRGKGMMNTSSYVLFSHHIGSYIPPEALRTDDLITSPCTSPKDDISANQQSRLQPMAGARSRLELEFQQSSISHQGRKFSQPTATISKGGMASLLRSLSISSRPGLVPPGTPAPPPPPPPAQSGLGDCEGAGEGLSLSPPHASAMTPVIADQALPHSPPPSSVPNSPSTAYAEARSRIDAIFSNVETAPLRRGLRGCRAESPPPTMESLSGVERMDSGGGMGGGAGNTSTFRRRRPQQQGQSQQRTAGINLMRGSMFQLNTTSTSVTSTAGGTPPMDMDMCYGYDSKQAPMTPGPGRRAPLRTQLSTSNESGQVIRPPRRSSSVCRELPGLCQQQQFLPQPQQQQHFFPPAGHLPRMDQQQPLNSNSHYAAPRGTQQHPQRVYADPRSFQQQQRQNGAPIAAVGTTATTAAAAQLAVEAVAARRHQQYGSSSGFIEPTPPPPPPPPPQ
uniref:Uncharacterized protein n=1 Tax=Echinococcus canadensis TaxID=519352 RepID=A0A915EUS3_9CEST